MRDDPRAWYALSAVVMAAVTTDVLLSGPLRHLDHVVHRWCDAHVRGGRLTVADAVALLGQRWTLLCVIVPLAVAAGWRSRSWRYPLVSGLTVVLLSVVEAVLKSVIPRTFPVTGRDVLFHGGAAYPSGHTLNAFVLGGLTLELLVVAVSALGDRLPAGRRHTVALVWGGLAGAALTLTDEHWLTDVLFSLALGPVLMTLLVASAPFARRR